MIFWAKYNTQTTFSFPMVKRAVVDLAVSADWTPAAADSAISKDQAAFADTTNTVAAVGGSPTRTATGWKITLTAAELSAAQVDLQIVDAATKAVEDQFITIYTYGNASAKVVNDWSDAVRMGLTALPNVASGSAGALLVDGTGTAAISNSSGKVLLQATQSGVTIPTVTTVTNQLTAAAIATGVWQDTTAGDFTTALSVGKSVMNGVSLGTGLTVASVSGAVGSVTGAVGSVTGNVGGNVVGSVASVTARVTANIDQIDGAALTAHAAGKMPADVLTWLGGAIPAVNVTGVPLIDLKYTLGTISPATAGSVRADVVTSAVSITGDLSATMKTSVENAVWDATMASHVTAGSTGAALNAAGGAGDPWITALPGAYAAGSAGFIIGTNLNAKVGDVKTQTDKLVFTVANKLDVNILRVNGIAVTGSGTAGSPWGP